MPTPPRARIPGLSASSFGDLILVDHEEIKFGQKAYLALVIIDGAPNLLLWATALTRRTTVFRRESLETKHFSPISSWLTTSFMASLNAHVDLVLLGLIVLRPQCAYSSVLGP